MPEARSTPIDQEVQVRVALPGHWLLLPLGHPSDQENGETEPSEASLLATTLASIRHRAGHLAEHSARLGFVASGLERVDQKLVPVGATLTLVTVADEGHGESSEPRDEDRPSLVNQSPPLFGEVSDTTASFGDLQVQATTCRYVTHVPGPGSTFAVLTFTVLGELPTTLATRFDTIAESLIMARAVT